ncbi:hypothetical protein CMO89_01060 [Candidatus Woesearchaeota archaeon]|nr:hypothetical protein [Candidatus Woesearchaeota archaeon]|tara:strand:+ start:14758 stop:15885 length:1128 start_codon:yes stop_codon:yes gene_type:complete
MKKLLIASDCFLPRWDGIARFLSEVIPSLSNDYDITVLAPRFKGASPEYRGVKVIRFPLLKIIRFGDTYPCIPKIKEIEKEVREADIVWTHTIGPIVWFVNHYAVKHKKPLVAYVHSLEGELAKKALKNFFKRSIVYYLTRTLGISLYNKCNLLLIPSKDVGKKLNEKGVKTRKRVVHLGVDTGKFVPSEDKSASKLKIGIKPKTKVIGFSGRIGREKDLMTLYKAFLRLKKEYSNLILLIAGKGIREQERILKKDKNVKLIGAVDNIVPYLQAMDIYVLPSLTETSSLSTMEAMSCGVPPVVTRIGYPKKYIKDKVNGCFFPVKNAYVLSIKLDSLLKDDGFREGMGEQARKTIKERFPWEKTVKEIREVLKSF